MRGIRWVVSGVALLLPPSILAAPSVTLTAPVAETRYLAPAAIELAADPVVDEGRTIERVEFLADGIVVGTATQAPWSFSWTNVVKGNYNLRARVVDSAGRRDNSPVVRVHVRENTAPKVRISAPEHRYISPGSVPLTATVTDRDDPIAKVEFFNGDALLATLTAEPYAINWSDVPAGIYEIRAMATDALGAVGTSNLFRVRVRDNAAPHVRILTPDNRDTFPAPAAISISLHANDRDDNLTNVELFANGAPLTTFTAAPFEFNWAGMQPGTYALTARATDDLGLITTSRAVNVTITGAPPVAEKKMYFIHVDHLNTPRLVADEQQRTVWRWDQQEPFGDSVPDGNPSALGAFEFPMRFPGQYFDKETNLHYNYFRDYDEATGRYVQSDPMGMAAGANSYSYSLLDPLSFVDPSGLITQIMIWEPVGWWDSSGGHVSTNVNGITYSFGGNGMTVMPTSQYLASQQFRQGVSMSLALTYEQEVQFAACLSGYQGPYNLISNNCGAAPQNCLALVGISIGSAIAPTRIGNNVLSSKLLNGVNVLPATQARRGFSAPWTR